MFFKTIDNWKSWATLTFIDTNYLLAFLLSLVWLSLTYEVGEDKQFKTLSV